jgi:hypothetical protein
LRTQVLSLTLLPAGKLRPVADGSGFRHLPSDIELVDKALSDDAVAAGRLRLAVAHGAFADLQAMDLLSLDERGKRTGGLTVARLSSFWRVDAADPDAYATGFRLAGKSRIFIWDRNDLEGCAEQLCGNHKCFSRSVRKPDYFRIVRWITPAKELSRTIIVGGSKEGFSRADAMALPQ